MGIGLKLPTAFGFDVWRWVALRGTGLPIDLVLRLGASEVARGLEELFVLEVDADAAHGRASAIVAARPLGRLAKELRARRVPEVEPSDPSVAEAIAAWRAASSALAAKKAAVEAELDRALSRVSEALREVARDPRFREAVAWQNRGALETGLDALLRQPAGDRRSKAREHERLVANYLQRYCVKNDTIGFFGPLGWAFVGSGGEPIRCAPGAELLSKRTVYFEHWCLYRVAAAFSEDPALKPELAPRLLGNVRVEGTTLHYSVDQTRSLAPELARLLSACDGTRSARQIADEDEIYELLDQLEEKKLITWSIPVPWDSAFPERAVLAAPLLSKQREALVELVSARDAVARAAGDAEAVSRSLGELEGIFSRITGEAGVRSAGKMYAGRTLVFEDCRRDLECTLGRELVERLAPPLSLVIRSARWFTHRVAASYRRLFLDAHRSLGGGAVDYLRFARAVSPLFSEDLQHGELPEHVRAIAAELASRWAEVLGISTAASRVDHRFAELEPRVKAAFDAPDCGWPAARLHSPDVMIAAASEEAIRAGDYSLILGELHMAMATASQPAAAKEHATPLVMVEQLLAAAGDTIVPLPPAGAADRLNQWDLSLAGLEHYFELESGAARSVLPAPQVLRAADLVVEEIDGHLFARAGSRSFEILVLFGAMLQVQLLARFNMLPSSPHSPRVTVDGVVFAREKWSFSSAELAFATAESAFDRFAGAVRWRREHRLPRFVFARVRGELKPCYVDLESPVYVDILAKLARKSSAISITEMLPAHDQAWLTDREGRRYASELRLTLELTEPSPI